MPFANPLALLGLLGIIPLIIVYLIRPRPKEILFSSTIFLQEGEAERSAVLSRLIFDPLFWVQLLILCSLSVAAAGPYTETSGFAGSHLVVVMDSSASMEDSFLQAESLAGSYLDGYDRISIVLAENIPISALSSGSPAEARDTLRRLSPRAVPADLSSAMLLAENLLGSEGGDILVVSDFVNWIGDDPESTRSQIEARGPGVVFADSYRGGSNAAIVDGWNVLAEGYVNHTALVHNFGPAKTFSISIDGPGGSSSRSATIPQGGDFYLSFTAYPGVNRISLDEGDAINSDNAAYVYVPSLKDKTVLYLGDESPALVALRSLPGVMVRQSGDYDSFDLVVAAANASTDGKLNRYIEGGGRVVFLPSSAEVSPEYLPVRLTDVAEGPANIWLRNPGFAEEIHFDEIGLFSYMDATPRRRSVTLAEANGAPLLSYWNIGEGTVVYDGLEMDSDFFMRPEYPIFWYQMVSWLTGVPDLSESNRKTGELILLGEPTTVQSPSGTITTSTLLLDEVGIYRYQTTTIAANMYDPAESDLRKTRSFPVGQFKGQSRETLVKSDLSNWVIALAAIALLGELAMLWWRREL
ncbi:MAG: hypothetical protein HPY61_00335 [Methanotrichaceae archaeon]|nr:hypothetical protein [Methanotrichaceae archaeon]